MKNERRDRQKTAALRTTEVEAFWYIFTSVVCTV